MDKCVSYRDDAQLDQLVGDGRILPEDADEIRDFAELLSHLGPADPTKGPVTTSALVALEEYSHDRDPEFAGKVRQRINERRSKDGC